jgi:hypothetical protein
MKPFFSCLADFFDFKHLSESSEEMTLVEGSIIQSRIDVISKLLVATEPNPNLLKSFSFGNSLS